MWFVVLTFDEGSKKTIWQVPLRPSATVKIGRNSFQNELSLGLSRYTNGDTEIKRRISRLVCDIHIEDDLTLFNTGKKGLWIGEKNLGAGEETVLNNGDELMVVERHDEKTSNHVFLTLLFEYRSIFCLFSSKSLEMDLKSKLQEMNIFSDAKEVSKEVTHVVFPIVIEKVTSKLLLALTAGCKVVNTAWVEAFYEAFMKTQPFIEDAHVPVVGQQVLDTCFRKAMSMTQQEREMEISLSDNRTDLLKGIVFLIETPKTSIELFIKNCGGDVLVLKGLDPLTMLRKIKALSEFSIPVFFCVKTDTPVPFDCLKPLCRVGTTMLTSVILLNDREILGALSAGNEIPFQDMTIDGNVKPFKLYRETAIRANVNPSKVYRETAISENVNPLEKLGDVILKAERSSVVLKHQIREPILKNELNEIIETKKSKMTAKPIRSEKKLNNDHIRLSSQGDDKHQTKPAMSGSDWITIPIDRPPSLEYRRAQRERVMQSKGRRFRKGKVIIASERYPESPKFKPFKMDRQSFFEEEPEMDEFEQEFKQGRKKPTLKH